MTVSHALVSVIVGRSSPTFILIEGNTSTDVSNSIYNDESTPIISHSIIEGAGGSTSWDSFYGTDNGNNIDMDPLFVNASTSNFHLNATSPAIDNGENDAVTVTADLDGNPRIVNGTVDMGAYEYIEQLLVFTPLQDTYDAGEVITLSLETYISADTSFEYADLWVAIKMPNSEFLFLTTMLFEPFSRTPTPFITSVENVENIYSILLFTVPAGIGGNYTFYAAYIEEGKNPMTDELSAILLSNLATTQMVLRNQ